MDDTTTHCSYCDEQVMTVRAGGTDRISDYRCAQCGEFVLIEGNARREQLRREEGRQIVKRVKEYADQLERQGSPQPEPSILQIKEGLSEIIDHIDAIDARIQEETKLDQNKD